MFAKYLILFLILLSRIAFGFEEIQNCEVEYYDIEGDSAKKLLKELKTKNQIEGGYFGYTRYSYRNKCAEVTTTCKVRIPRWVGFEESENQDLKNQWSRFYTALIEHEQGHVNIFVESMNTVKENNQGKSCSTASLAYSTAFKELSKKQKDYDHETEHGVKNGAFFGANSFQAIAFSQGTGKYGFAYDFSTQESAESKAMENCEEEDCKVVMWSKNSCLSLAVGKGNGYGTNWAKSNSEAEAKAINSCKKYTKNCKTLKTVCPSE